jgi:hypothetical protein
MAQSSDALIRFVHVVPGAAAVDIFTDGQLTISNLDFGEASNYVKVPAQAHTVAVTQAGATTPLWEQEITPGAGSALTLVAASTEPLTFTVYEDNLDPLRLGQARLTAIHAVDGGPTLDLALTDGQPALPGLEYNQAAGTLDVPALLYEFVAVPSGESVDNAVTEVIPAALNSGTSYTLLIYGSANAPETLWLSAPVSAEPDSGFVRLAHGVIEGPAADVYLNDTLVAPSLEFGGNATEYIALPTGEYSLSFAVAGSEESLGGAEVSVDSGGYVTAVALGSPDTVSISLFDDDVTAINENESVFRLINAISGDAEVSLQLGDGTTLVENIAPGEAGEAVVEPGSEGVKAVVGSGESVSEFDLIGEVYGGVYYNALAVDGSDPQVVLLSPVSLAQTVTSAPSGTTLAAAPSSEVVVLEPTAEVVAQAATATLAEVVPAPTEEPQVVPAQVTPPPATPTGPTARIVLDPGANLQLRQYPDSNALSLGLAPSGTILLVNGRQGEPALPEGATPDPSATEFIDPATLVPEDGDLIPEETWLHITYNTPDGGAIDAWINSLYVDLRNEDGDRMRLADLPMVPENQPGEARSTDITPPPIPEDRVVARVFNLDTGVNLNIRRTAETGGEVLERVGNGTLMEFLGLKESGDWVFVRYSPAGGGTITGWVNAIYVELLFNDQLVTLEELEARELLVFTPDDERGEVRGDVGGVVLPTIDPLRDAVVAEVTIDPGANLHLRLTPDSNGESLALIPSGTLLLVTGRTGESLWVQVEFEGVQGWVSSAYVRLTFNGARFELANVPALTTPAPTTPTEAPAAPAATETPTP